MKLYVLIGLPGVGKSTWTVSRFTAAEVYSSDRYRHQMFGDVNDQSHNNDVFQQLYADMENEFKLQRRYEIVFDATNLNIKRRKYVIDLAHRYNVLVEAVVFIEPLDVILQRNSQRERVVPEESIRQKYKTFHVPVVTEDWDNVRYVGSEEYVPVDEINVRQFVRDLGLHIPSIICDCKGFDQRNPHHTLDLYEHTMKTWSHLNKNNADWLVQLAAMYHDVGKLYTQTIGDNGIAHYYGHQYVSTQLAIQELRRVLNSEDLMYITSLIHYHMDVYNHKDTVDVAKLARRLNHAELFTDLILLHESDVLAH